MSGDAVAVPRRVVSSVVSLEQRAALERLADQGDRTLSQEIRRAIAAHLERDDEEDDR